LLYPFFVVGFSEGEIPHFCFGYKFYGISKPVNGNIGFKAFIVNPFFDLGEKEAYK